MDHSPEQVRSYYNAFLSDRMLSYRIKSNLRIEKAIVFFNSHIEPDNVVLDIGCGIGIATEAMGKRAKRVVGIDLSEQNIWYAKQSIQMPNMAFHCLDIVNQSSALADIFPAAPNIITLCDVIEHIPEKARPQLLKQIVQLGASNLKLLLTFPSQFYQNYIVSEVPSELQIIDNVISLDQLAREAADAGLLISHFQFVDVWKQAQYVHCVLEPATELERRSRQDLRVSALEAKWRRIKHVSARLFFERGRRKRYITDIFKGER